MMDRLRYHFLQVHSLEEVPMVYVPRGLTNVRIRDVGSLRGSLRVMPQADWALLCMIQRLRHAALAGALCGSSANSVLAKRIDASIRRG